MNGKEVGSIIGKGGEIINGIREQSGCKIHITDGSVPERIVTITGSTNDIIKAFGLICKKFEDDGGSSGAASSSSSSSSSRDRNNSSSSNGGVTFRLVVPASQCGSLIGKGGSKIKEIREVTGVSIQVASEMLPNSTERAVTISGNKESITQCIFHVCCTMLESPPKSTPIPYSPKSGGAYGGGLLSQSRGGRDGGRGSHHHHHHQADNALASLLGLGNGAASSTLAALATLAGSQIRDQDGGGSRGSGRRGDRDHDRDHESSSSNSRGSSSTQTYEMSIPNDLIGCIIGKGGSKIAEIRQISGAMIRISKSDEDHDDNPERQITISGQGDNVALAKSLINMSLDIHKNKLDDRESRGGGDRDSRDNRDSRDSRYGRDSRDSSNRDHDSGAAAAAAGLGLAQLLSKPETLTALTTLASLNGGGLGGLTAAQSLLGGLQVTGVHRSRGGGAYGGGSSRRDDDRGSRNSKRIKFEPY